MFFVNMDYECTNSVEAPNRMDLLVEMGFGVGWDRSFLYCWKVEKCIKMITAREKNEGFKIIQGY